MKPMPLLPFQRCWKLFVNKNLRGYFFGIAFHGCFAFIIFDIGIMVIYNPVSPIGKNVPQDEGRLSRILLHLCTIYR